MLVGMHNRKNDISRFLLCPATKLAIEVMRQELGTEQPDEYLICMDDFYYLKIQGATMEEINCLSARLEQLTSDQLYVFRIVEKNHPEYEIGEMIDLAYNVDSFKLLKNYHSDYDLGKYVLENKLNGELNSLPKGIYDLLDHGMVGRGWQEESGVELMYGENGCVYPIDEWETVFDEENLPIQPQEYIVKLKSEGLELALPAAEKELQEYIRQTKSSELTVCSHIQSDKEIPANRAGYVNDLCREIAALPDAQSFKKFRAVLALAGADADELEIIRNLDQYEYIANPEEYGRSCYEKYCEGSVSSEMLGYIDFKKFGCDMMLQQDAALTKYGVLQKRQENQSEETNSETGHQDDFTLNF